MAAPKLPMHGRTHRRGGSDPAPGGAITDGDTSGGVISGASVTVEDVTIIEVGKGLRLTETEARVAHLRTVPVGPDETEPGAIWVGDDCCLHWICPADGLEYKVCGELVEEVAFAAHAYGTVSHTNPAGAGGDLAEAPFTVTSIENVDEYVDEYVGRFVVVTAGVYALTLEGTLSAETVSPTGMSAGIYFTISPADGGDIVQVTSGAISISETRTLEEGCHVAVAPRNYNPGTFTGYPVTIDASFTMDWVEA